MDKVKLQSEFRAVEAKAKPLAEKDALTEAEAAEFGGYVSQMEGLRAQIDLADRAQAAFAPSVDAKDRIEVRDVADEAKYAMGEFLQDVAYAARTGEKKVRLVRHQQRSKLAVMGAATGLNEGLPADGGFLVGTDFTGEMVKRAYDNSQLVSRVSKMGISGAANSMVLNGVDETSRALGSRFGGVQGYWVAEAGSITASKPKFRKIEFILKKQAVLYYATDEVLQDAAALEADVRDSVTGELEFMLQDAIVNGNGAGKPLGILASPSLVTISKETGQAADTIEFENISKMWAAMWAPSRQNAVWLINQEIEPQLDLMAIPVGTSGMPAYMPPGGVSGQPYGTLKGRPVIAIEQAAALGDLGDIMLVDPGQYRLVDKGGVQSASSMHVNFTTDEMVFRFIYRVDGQPLWHSALTPFKGTQTQSPFITLEARA